MLEKYLTIQLNDAKQRGLYNNIDVLQNANNSLITINNKEYINLASNNYLGLANNEEMINESIKAINRFGVGAGAVRPINGTLSVHEELEQTIAQFKGTESAIVFQSGFNCNMGVISALMNSEDVIISDELNHASIIDGCRLSQATIVRVKHQDMDDLKRVIVELRNSKKYNKIMYITDGVFSMDGTIAKLPQIVEIAKKYDVITYVDDAHGSGVMGLGHGTAKHFGLEKEIDIQMGTLSKAVGSVGGYVAGSKLLIDWLKLRARPFLFSTALPAGDTKAATTALRIIDNNPNLVNDLWEKARYFQLKLKELRYNIGNTQTPITPIYLNDEVITQEFAKRLFDEGVYVKAIVYPTVPKGKARIRNMPTAIHTMEQLDRVVQAYEKVGKDMKII